ALSSLRNEAEDGIDTAINVDRTELDENLQSLQILSDEEAFSISVDLKGAAKASRQIAILKKQAGTIAQQAQQPAAVGSDVEATEAQRQAQARVQEKLARISQTYMTERQLEIQHHQERMQFITAAEQSKLDLHANFNELQEKEKERHAKAMKTIEAQSAKGMRTQYSGFLGQMERLDDMSMTGRFNTIAGGLAQITAAGSRHNKKMFELNKAAGIAQAIVSTFIGANKAWELGPLIGPPLAAMVIAAG